MPRPVLSQASADLTREVEVMDERGRVSTIHIPAERPLTVYVDKRELVTLMTLGGAPEAPATEAAHRANDARPVPSRRRAVTCLAMDMDIPSWISRGEQRRLREGEETPGSLVTCATVCAHGRVTCRSLSTCPDSSGVRCSSQLPHTGNDRLRTV